MDEMAVLIRYGEVALKGGNRHHFERILMRRIKEKVSDLMDPDIKSKGGLLIMDITKEINDLNETKKNDFLGRLRSKLLSVFGIDSISFALITKPNLSYIIDAAPGFVEQLRRDRAIDTFKVEAKRSDKSFPAKSPEIASKVGAGILKAVKNIGVDVHNPDLIVNVNVRNENAYIYEDRIRGQGGLPLGACGKGLLLLSGGIDSPVAGFLMARRGMSISAVHFNSYPYTSKRALDKVMRLKDQLAEYVGNFDVRTVNLLPAQMAIRSKAPENEGTILTRRFMIRIANIIAEEVHANALITGESLGQVASQTAESLAVTDAAANLPILRPLIAYDKRDIIGIAKDIGCYDISVEPFEDCCTVFLPKHPVTKPRLENILRSEEKLDISGLVQEVLEASID
ncbi:thiamine biosynthesis/tRNA modification protein ThiI [Eubacterium saphenum ATCC 49989]|nr:thiamine biosynthesis/tRNA modification protein ThiI [Eubacterium saphenum ATCC 49989]